MYTAALSKSDATARPPGDTRQGPSEPLRVPALIRYLDLLVLTIALPVFVIADLPLAGYGAAAGAWLAQRGIQFLLQRRAAAADDPRTVVGLAVGSMIARGWLVALAIFGVGLAGTDDDGLAAAVMILTLFTLYLTIQFIVRPLELPGKGPH